MTICGECKNTMMMYNSEFGRYLECPTCVKTYPLPKNG